MHGSRGTHNHPSPNAARSHAHSAANLRPRCCAATRCTSSTRRRSARRCAPSREARGGCSCSRHTSGPRTPTSAAQAGCRRARSRSSRSRCASTARASARPPLRWGGETHATRRSRGGQARRSRRRRGGGGRSGAERMARAAGWPAARIQSKQVLFRVEKPRVFSLHSFTRRHCEE